MSKFTAQSFGEDFLWGIAISAAQNEGAYTAGGKSLSIWDSFARRTGKIKNSARPYYACDFYHRYKDDLMLVKALGFKVFRFSIAWSRIFPDRTGQPNKEGIKFYNDVIDECLKLDIVPCITLYHWDLPTALEKEGGWASHKILKWFTRFTTTCTQEFGDRVKNWIILNEPAAFTSLGYMLGKHAPGKTGIENFFPAVHHALMAQAEGGRIVKEYVSKAHVGTSFSCSEVMPFSNKEEDLLAAKRVDILLNRLFIDPLLGKGIPDYGFKFIEKMVLYNKSWKYTRQMKFDFDFIGLQYYFPVTVKYNRVIPFIQATEVSAAKRNVPHTGMGWEINSDSFYRTLKRFWLYYGIKEIIVTENGASFPDKLVKGTIQDEKRINFFQQYLKALLKAKNEGVNIKGYFVWTLMDNFEWAQGFQPKFGLIHTDFKSQLRTIKQSGYWFRDFLSGKVY